MFWATCQHETLGTKWHGAVVGDVESFTVHAAKQGYAVLNTVPFIPNFR